MRRTKIATLLFVIVCTISLVACSADNSQNNQEANLEQKSAPASSEISYEDGTYRGGFSDRGQIQVNIQFKLEDNIVKEAEFRHLYHKGIDYLEEEDPTIVGLKEQHEELIKYLEGKDIRESLTDLYEPGNIVTDDVDTFTGATLRSSKVISAIRDALNRGVYKY